MWLCCLFVSSPTLAEESPDEIALQPGYGYVLIRVIFPHEYRIASFEMTNFDTGDVVKTNSRMYKSAGLNAWMCLVAIPKGRYFLSEYRWVLLRTPRASERYTQEGPRSASDIFEIVPGVINYAGDWLMRINTRNWNPIISHNIKTVERLIDRYPEYANRYEIYLSMMGKNAISLKEFLKLVKEHSDPVIE